LFEFISISKLRIYIHNKKGQYVNIGTGPNVGKIFTYVFGDSR